MISLTSLQSRNQLFWLLNISGWCALGLFHYLTAYLYGEQWSMFWYRVAGVVVGILGGWALREIYRHSIRWKKRYKVPLVVVASYALAIPLTVATNYILLTFYSSQNDYAETATLFRSHFVYFLHFFIWSISYYGLVLYREVLLLKQSELDARNLARDAQLKMLRYQLNPHFLFNTLNAISSLILLKDTQPANQMVLRLSDFLRHSLMNDPMQQVTLEQEVRSLQLYLGIEKARFESRLNVEFNIDDEAYAALIPSLILQPIVENSIKYAIAPSVEGGTIFVNAKVFAEQLLIEIRDTGPGSEKDLSDIVDDVDASGCGVGLVNCQQRLSAIYDGDYSFSFGNLSPVEPRCGFQVSLRLPLARQK